MALSFELLRAEDLLALRIDTVNIRLDAADPKNPVLVREHPNHPAYLIVQFPPQAIAEKAYFEVAKNVPDSSTPPQSGDDPLDPPGSVPVRMSGASRLVFRLPKSVEHVAFRMDALLDWSAFDLVLSDTALGKPKAPPIVAPSALETALEIPYRLFLSPCNDVGWAHAHAPSTHAGRTELWHTRIGKVVSVQTKTGSRSEVVEAGIKDTVPLRAIWSPDFADHGLLPSPADDGPFLMAMSPRDRAEIVILTSGASGYYVEDFQRHVSPWVPQPILASRLFLSALGGWLSSRGSWPLQPAYTPSNGGETQQLEISEWVHLATQARDHYVRVVYEGFLYPFGHRASLIKVTERKVVPADGALVDYPTAYLKQHMYVVVREREKRYTPASYTYAGREMPLQRSIRINTLITPDIDKPSYIPDGSADPSSFWIDVGNAGYPFHVSGIDLAGRTIDFLARLIFVAESEPNPSAVQSAYKSSGDARLCSVRGQKVAYANPAAGDTELKTTALFFDTELLQNAPPYPTVPFVPYLDQAGVGVPALERLTGSATPVTIQLYGEYLSTGLDANAAVFAQIANPQPSLQFSADKSGGFATPNLTLTALSAKKGLVAGSPGDAAHGIIKPKEFFGDLSAQLFGTVPLQALIKVDGGGAAPADKNAPEIRSVLSPNRKNPDALITKIAWSPQLVAYHNDPVRVDFDQNGQQSALTLDAKFTTSLNGAPPESSIKGELTNFAVTLMDVVGITFNSLKFTSNNGQKMMVKADLPSTHPIGFEGELAFIQQLADILPPGIFGGKGPSIDLKPDKIRVTYTLGLPSVSVGVLAIQGMSIMTGLDLPYLDGKPELEFAFASRSSPFLITVECLGGGGFVHLVVDADGVQMVEGALEFGGQFSLDLGVASGGVRIMAGIYFQLTGTSTVISGFVDVSGEVSVLGIISISLDLNLTLTYKVSDGKKLVEGRATLTVAVHVLFFSASVQVSMEKSFAADGGDPRIHEVLTAADWSAYSDAFA